MTAPHQHLPRTETITLPDGRTLHAGQEVKIVGESGAFRVAYGWTPDGSVTAYGPVDTQHACWRSFRPARIRTIHRKPRSRAGLIAAEAE